MAIHPFHTRLANLRAQSRWPDQEEFAYQVGLSLGGYRKFETGERIPGLPVLQQIFERANVDPHTADELLRLRNDAKALQGGLILFSQTQSVDCDVLAKRIRTEVLFVLKQSGVDVHEKTRGVMEKRIAMILKSMLGVQ